MALDPKAEAALALHRFGFGPRAGSIAAIAADPRGAVLQELYRPRAGLVAGCNQSAAQISRAVFEFNAERQAQSRLEKMAQEGKQDGKMEGGQQRVASAVPGSPAGVQPGAAAPAPLKPDAKPAPPLPQQLFQAEVQARVDAATGAEIGFVERLVWFWSNHFCVSSDKVQAAVAGAYEREAIRAHVLGRFVDMLQAVESHPAMLAFLDNAQSLGPRSVNGINRDKGLNENLAREIMELHTLGVRTGYSQADVTNFAKVITGWTVIPDGPDPQHGGEFVFNRLMHEPGSQMVIGRVYPHAGVDQGRAVLADLARNPATARHIATKLARHFVADQPPPTLVDRLAHRFLDNDGDLRDLAATLVSSPEAWTPTRAKLKRPGEWMIGALRTLGTPPDVGQVMQAQNLLGEPLWRPPAPNGFSDDSAAWMDGLAQRLDIANAFARRFAGRAEPAALVDTALGPLASHETRQSVARAESREQAVALLLMTPEFQRR